MRISLAKPMNKPLFSNTTKGIIVNFILVLLISAIVTKLGLNFWLKNNGIVHTILESICVFITLSAFALVWHTHERTSIVNHVLGYGFLVVAILDILHIYNYFGLYLYPSRLLDLSSRFGLVLRLTESLVIMLVAFNIIRFRLNKWASLLLTTSAPVLFSFILYHRQILPAFYTSAGYTQIKTNIEYVIILIFFLSLYRLRKQINNKEIITYKYIFMALLLAIPAELSFAFPGYKTVDSEYAFFRHILKVVYYLFLYRGIFVSAVTYPYEQLDEILNEIPMGIITYDTDPKLNFANSKAVAILGYAKKDLIGLAPKEMSIKLFQDQKKQLTKDKDLENVNPFDRIIKVKKPDGTVIQIKCDIHKLENKGFLHIFNDAREEQVLENLQIQTQTILNSIQNGVFLIDKNKKIIMCNFAFEKMAEIPVNNMLGLDLDKLNELLYIEQKGSMDKGLKQINLEKPETTILSGFGNKKDIIIQISTIFGVDEEILGGIGVVSDVTDFKEEQEKLKQQEKLAVLGQMAAGVVHEIRNPLTTIKGFSQLILAKQQNEQITQYASLIDQEADNVNKVVSDFLEFAKPKPPKLEKVSLNKLIESIYLMVETQSYLEGVNVQLELVKMEKEIWVDENQIKQVILNVVKNAIEAMPGLEKPELIIKTDMVNQNNEMKVIITDNGNGMAEEIQKTIGTPFFTTKDNGTGLGLSISYQIIKEHNGRLEIVSKLDQGTTVIITLPCFQD